MTKYKKIILIELNGIRADFFRRLVKENKLSNIEKIFMPKGNYYDIIGYAGGNPQAVSAALLSGEHPAKLEIPSVPRFIKRKKQVEKKRINLSAKMKKATSILYGEFENPVNIYSDRPTENSNLGFFERKKRNWVLNYAKKHNHWEMLDRSATKTMIKLLGKNHDFYHLTYYSQGKANKHEKDGVNRIEFNLDLLDYNLGLIYDKIKAQKLVDETLIIIVGSQPQGQLNSSFDLAGFFVEKGFKTAENYSSVKSEHQILTIQTGKSLASVYFRPESKNWVESSGFQENSSIKQKASNLLISRQEVDQVFYRIDEDKVRVLAKWGSSILSWDKGKIFYDVISGNDPFNLNNRKASWSSEESFDITWKSRYPDVLWQIRHLFELPDSGDMFINAKRGYCFASKESEIKRSAGSLNTDHLLLPVLINIRTNMRIRRPDDLNKVIMTLNGKSVDNQPTKGRERPYQGKRKKNKRYAGSGQKKKLEGGKPQKRNEKSRN